MSKSRPQHSNRQTPVRSPQGLASTRRDELRHQQNRAAREQRIRSRISITVLALLAVAILGVLAWVITQAVGTAGSSPPPNGDGLVIGDPAAPVEVVIYQDFMCPACGAFERANRLDIDQLVANGTARVVIHPMNFKDHSSQGTRFSTRAANALVAVAMDQPDKALAFNAALYDHQPEQNTTGLTDAEIASIARQAGVSESVVGGFALLAHEEFVQASNDAAETRIHGTPTVLVNQRLLDDTQLYTAGPLRDAIEAAAG